ncbi:hypothetical protein [Actinosynnema sp. ALI-1.44]|uniref:hypothetical protein n=1 Tax=Actinosynnema sp. ALI-1.44 TaxID=1933779 RepID=UPI001177908D|nr:hypothetical protein [Actinosynnema sp. ALI-1.44]
MGVISSLVGGEIVEEVKESVEVERADWLRVPPGLWTANRPHWREVVDPLVGAFNRFGNELVEVLDVGSEKGIAQNVLGDLRGVVNETTQGAPIPRSPNEPGSVILDSHFRCDGSSGCGLCLEKVKAYEDAGIDAGLEPGKD